VTFLYHQAISNSKSPCINPLTREFDVGVTLVDHGISAQTQLVVTPVDHFCCVALDSDLFSVLVLKLVLDEIGVAARGLVYVSYIKRELYILLY
jgi:hypothetical protein